MTAASRTFYWRVASLAAAVGGATFGFLLGQPIVDASAGRIEDARARLQSERVAFATQAGLERERDRLRGRFASAAAGHEEGDLLRRLAAVTRARGVRLVSADFAPSGTSDKRKPHDPARLDGVGARLELEGSYRSLLLTIDELGRTSDLIRIEPPSLRASGSRLAATVELMLLRPSYVQ
jgi:hypothetical protein